MIDSYPSIIKNYINRPPNLNNYSLIKFAKSVNCINNKYKLRSNDYIVRIFPQLYIKYDDEEDEKYYKLRCILNVPFRSTFDNVLNDNISTSIKNWHDLYLSIDDYYHCDFDISHSEDDEMPEFSENNKYQNLFEIASGMNNNVSNEQLGKRLIDISHDWVHSSRKYPKIDVVESFLKTYKFCQPFEDTVINDNNIINYSKEQEYVLKILEEQINVSKIF